MFVHTCFSVRGRDIWSSFSLALLVYSQPSSQSDPWKTSARAYCFSAHIPALATRFNQSQSRSPSPEVPAWFGCPYPRGPPLLPLTSLQPTVLAGPHTGHMLPPRGPWPNSAWSTFLPGGHWDGSFPSSQSLVN